MAEDNFKREIEALIEEIPQAHQRLVAELAGWAIQDVVDTSPVRTGAYRASHTVIGGNGTVVYEGNERVGDDEVVPTFPPARYEPANGGDAEREVAELEPFQRLEIRNGRFYAAALEFGGPTNAPRAIYQTAEANAHQRAEALAQRGLDLKGR